MTTPSLHPLIDAGLPEGRGMFPGGALRCRCAADRVEVTITGNVAHNHACGCSKCWKPADALFSVVGVVPVDHLRVTAHEEKLAVVDEAATIRRHACRCCGVHMYGRIVEDHPFRGLDFVHVELSDEKGWQPPQFAAFVSSIIEQGYHPEGMDDVRSRLKSLGLEPYDCLSPPLMDAIAAYTAKKMAKLSAAVPVPAPQHGGMSAAPVTAAGSATSPSLKPSAEKTPTGIAGLFSKLFGG